MPNKRTSVTISEFASDALNRLSTNTDQTISEILNIGLGFWEDMLKTFTESTAAFNPDFPRTVTRSIVVEPQTLRRLDSMAKLHGVNRSVLCDLCIRVYDLVFLENVKKLEQLLPKVRQYSDELRDLQKKVKELDLMDEEDVLDYLGMSEAYLDQGIFAIEKAIEHKTLVKNNI